MRRRSPRFVAVIAFGLLLGLAGQTAEATPAQSTAVTADTLQELQHELDDLRLRLGDLREVDAGGLGKLQGELDRLEEELTYLRVKLRKDGFVSRTEYNEVRSMIDEFGTRVERNVQTELDTTAAVVPVGTEVDVRLQSSLNSDTANVEDRFFATTVGDLVLEGRVVVPAGSTMRGLVSAVDRSSRTDRTSSMTLSFDELTVDGRTYPVMLTVTEAIERGGLREDAEKIGIGAGVGGILGGLIGGVKGALTGILIGAGGSIIATEGEDVNLPAGTVLRVRFDAPVTVYPAFDVDG